jgi:hypothetical protein
VIEEEEGSSPFSLSAAIRPATDKVHLSNGMPVDPLALILDQPPHKSVVASALRELHARGHLNAHSARDVLLGLLSDYGLNINDTIEGPHLVIKSYRGSSSLPTTTLSERWSGGAPKTITLETRASGEDDWKYAEGQFVFVNGNKLPFPSVETLPKLDRALEPQFRGERAWQKAPTRARVRNAFSERDIRFVRTVVDYGPTGQPKSIVTTGYSGWSALKGVDLGPVVHSEIYRIGPLGPIGRPQQMSLNPRG